LAEAQPQIVMRVRDAGHEIALHGHTHRRVDAMTPDAFGAELDAGLAALWRAAGVRPCGHRAPYFSLRHDMGWAFAALAGRGFCYDSSVFPARTPLPIGGDPAAPPRPYRDAASGLMEFPVTTLRALGRAWPMGGGFYVRALPLAVARRAIRQANAAGAPAVLYVHPWELDTGQRYPHITARERITHYWGRAGLANKLRALLTEFPFVALEDLMHRGGAENAETDDSIPSSSASSVSLR
jgi:polysaccharide deacetylase family protein (PEP-CTERM system associated)